MNIFEGILLGILQGLTEFLPVSSSGHLVLFRGLLGIEGEFLLFDTMLHVGTLAAVCLVFYKDIVKILKKPFQKLTYMLALATVPAVLFTLLFDSFFEGAFEGKSVFGSGHFRAVICFYKEYRKRHFRAFRTRFGKTSRKLVQESFLICISFRAFTVKASAKNSPITKKRLSWALHRALPSFPVFHVRVRRSPAASFPKWKEKEQQDFPS